eukprot:TRINITY_DN12404_c0_g1_i1.p1 TRINITY_DN12404_c0_g1~~TRINITY_DN12404_c0_g1_i1.p1  ORF type:complete len:343 (-),score=65.81 TRINITY_DN12404_c0_g1_i1:67-1095(-)
MATLSFLDLPHDVLNEILPWLDIDDVSALAQTCRLLEDTVRQSQMWEFGFFNFIHSYNNIVHNQLKIIGPRKDWRSVWRTWDDFRWDNCDHAGVTVAENGKLLCTNVLPVASARTAVPDHQRGATRREHVKVKRSETSADIEHDYVLIASSPVTQPLEVYTNPDRRPGRHNCYIEVINAPNDKSGFLQLGVINVSEVTKAPTLQRAHPKSKYALTNCDGVCTGSVIRIDMNPHKTPQPVAVMYINANKRGHPIAFSAAQPVTVVCCVDANVPCALRFISEKQYKQRVPRGAKKAKTYSRRKATVTPAVIATTDEPEQPLIRQISSLQVGANPFEALMDENFQ